MAAVVLTALGLVVLAGRLQNSGGYLLAQTGATTYLFAGILVVAAEALNLNGGFEQRYPLVVVYVVMAFLAQAAMGGALLLAGLLPAWIGWLSVVWNLGWLILLPLVSRKDFYFPVLHHFAPLLIGIALLLNAP